MSGISIKNLLELLDMEFYETDKYELLKFIANKKAGGEFTEEYLVLYNFAEDCKYSRYIQPELAICLLPFYLEALEQAVINYNKIATDIYFEFNLVLFFNYKNLKAAIGEKNYQYIMDYYIKETIKKMGIKNKYMLEWVSLFNTAAAFGNNNIKYLLQEIYNSTLNVKYSFFQYISVLLFKESDNLLAEDGRTAYWTSDIWNFDDGYFSHYFFWNDNTIKFFDMEINRNRIEALYKETEPLIYNTLGKEITGLFHEEMDKSFETGIFNKRKAEYLEKISFAPENHIYWDNTF